jgi:hypothetical protein
VVRVGSLDRIGVKTALFEECGQGADSGDISRDISHDDVPV